MTVVPDPTTEALALADELRDGLSFVQRPPAERAHSAEEILRALAARLEAAEKKLALVERQYDELLEKYSALASLPGEQPG